MRNCKKKQCGCNKQKQSCSCKQKSSNCSQYKVLAQEKCEKAEFINNKANRIAQEALCAERKAEALKAQAIDECKRANELWAEYNQLIEKGLCLMEQAEDCLAKSTECYANQFNSVEGCDLSDFGYNPNNDDCHSNCNCGCNKYR